MGKDNKGCMYVCKVAVMGFWLGSKQGTIIFWMQGRGRRKGLGLFPKDIPVGIYFYRMKKGLIVLKLLIYVISEGTKARHAHFFFSKLLKH